MDHTAPWNFDNIHEQVNKALSSLVLTDDVQYVLDAFDMLSYCDKDAEKLTDPQARKSWATVQRIVGGGKPLRTDEKLEFGTALWELHEYLTREYYRHYGVD